MKSSPLYQKPEISVVVPLFNEEANMDELYRRLVGTLKGLGHSFELIFVNDGSRDATPRLLDDLHGRDERVVVVHLSRNFGQQPAYCAGIEQARGRAVILMDGDLQDPPEVLEKFIAAWKEGHEVVYAVRTKRKESLWKRTCYALFYRMFRAASEMDMPLDSGDFCLLDRKVVRALRRLPERHRFLRGLRSYVGFRQLGVTYERAARSAGETKFTLRRLVRLAMDGLVGFSGLPLALITWLGAGTLLGAIGFTAWLLFALVSGHESASGWGLTLDIVLWLGAVQLLSLGVMGEYVRRIFLESKGRPAYIVRDVRRTRRSTQEVLLFPETPNRANAAS